VVVGRAPVRDEPQKFDRWISQILRAGVLASSFFVVLGGIMYLRTDAAIVPQYGRFRSEPTPLRTFDGILREAAAFHGPGLIQLGLLLLVATPIARVMLSVVEFVRVRDRLYVAITLVVLSLLMTSLLGVK
jgi:uncharacterized membrane protein